MRIAVFVVVLGLAAAGPASAQAPVADYFSTTSRLNSQPLAAGVMIEAFDSDGVRCGMAEANPDGSFLIHVYGNDPMTPTVDEGAREGEMLEWRVAGDVADSVEWVNTVIGLFADARFENGAAKEIHIDADPLAVEGTTWAGVKSIYRR